MRFIIYDCEVFKYDWLIVFKPYNEEPVVIINDSEALLTYYEANKQNIFVGFNNKHYDDYIFKAILSGLNPKMVNDFIIKENRYGWEYPGIKWWKLNALDLRKDIIGGVSLSLKEIEANMGINIEESKIPFDIDRKLTPEEIEETIKYCKHDVFATEKLLELRYDYIQTKIELLSMFDLPLHYIGKTNAQLTAIILRANKQERYDEFEYEIPDEIKLENSEIKALYQDKLDYDNTLTLDICNVPHILAYGGLHGARSGHFTGNIWYVDVSSYYPAIAIEYNALSRNIPKIDKYVEIRDLRLKYKKEKNPKENLFKLLLNTTFGASKDQYNQLYDPKMANRICITGQLLLVDLLEKLEPHIIHIQSNTDGLVFISNNDNKCQEIINEWQTRVRMAFKIERVKQIWQKDVNNYIIEFEDGYFSTKGAFVRLYKGGNWVRNSHSILDECVFNHFVYNIPVEETIEKNKNDIIKFQYVCKKGYIFDYMIHKNSVIENTNRIFATTDKSKGTVYRCDNNGRKVKVASISEYCIIHNGDLTNIKASDLKLDYNWYINAAKDRIKKFFKEV